MPFLDFLQSLPLPILCAVTVALSLLAGWLILGGVRVTLRLRGWDPAKPINVPELATITSVLFALLLSFSAAGVWNDWQQAQNAVRREALALENVLGLANGLPVERGEKLKERVVSYAKAAAKYEWPAMAYRADMDDLVFKALDAVLAGLTIELSSEIAQGDASPIAPMLLPQIFEARSARLVAAEPGAFLDLSNAVVRAGTTRSPRSWRSMWSRWRPRRPSTSCSRTTGRSLAPLRSVPSRCCSGRKAIGAARFRATGSSVAPRGVAMMASLCSDQSMTAIALISIRQRGSVASRTT